MLVQLVVLCTAPFRQCVTFFSKILASGSTQRFKDSASAVIVLNKVLNIMISS